MSNARRLRKRYAPVRTDFTAFSLLRLDKEITRLESMRAAEGVHLTKAGRTQLVALREERRDRL